MIVTPVEYVERSIRERNYKLFEQQIAQGFDSSARLQYGNTLLHSMATFNWKDSVGQTVKSIFTITATMQDWLRPLIRNLPKSVTKEDFFTMQNDRGCTCIHIAIENDNWIFAHAAIIQFGVDYRVHWKLFRRDRDGLTEYERFLVTYGIAGRREEFQMLFHDADCSIEAIKTAAKAFKIVNLVGHGPVILASTHDAFEAAQELKYPNPYAAVDDARALEHIYELNGLEDPKTEVRARDLASLEPDLSEIARHNNLNETPDNILSFLHEFSKDLLYQGNDPRYIVNLAYPLCTGEPSSLLELQKESVMDDLRRISKLDFFSRYSTLIGKLFSRMNELRQT